MQSTPTRVLRAFTAGALLLGTAAAQEEAQDPVPVTVPEPEPETAGPAELDRLLAQHAAAEDAGDGTELARLLDQMIAFDNPELLEPALEALKYRASKLDRAAAETEAEELGMTDRDEIEAFVLEREALVQARGARLAANFPEDKKTARGLLKAFKDKAVRKDKPEALAGVIDALGRIQYGKVEKDVFAEFRRYGDEDVMRACVRFFGQIGSRDKSVVRALIGELSAPEPGNVDAATNPPASYWEARWKTWSAIRRDVSWALLQITGQVFRPASGDFRGDGHKALQYVKDHERELGLK